MIIFLIMISIILGVSAEFLPLDMTLEYGWCRVIAYTSMTIQVFLLVPYKQHYLKALCFVHCLWAVFNIFIQLVMNADYLHYSSLFLIETIFFVLFFFYMLFKSYDLPSDKYSDKEVLIVFKQPEGFIAFLHSCVFRPASSVSVVSNGIQYCYKLGANYHARKYEPKESHFYLKVNFSDDHVRKTLIPLCNVSNPECTESGRQWGLFNNCCHAVIRLYPSIKVGILNTFPSFLVKQLKAENDRQDNS